MMCCLTLDTARLVSNPPPAIQQVAAFVCFEVDEVAGLSIDTL